MGCWNETCLLSNLPIKYEEPVVGYLIHHHLRPLSVAGGYCMVDDIAKPIGLPFYGFYDDYGSIVANDSDLAVELMLKRFNVKTSAKLFSKILDRKLSLPRYRQDAPSLIGLVMFHKDIFDSVTALRESEITFEEVKKKITLCKKNNQATFAELVSSQLRLDQSYITNMIGQNDTKIKIFTNLINQHKNINSLFAALRLMWAPQNGTGSQDVNYDDHEFLANAILKQIATSR